MAQNGVGVIKSEGLCQRVSSTVSKSVVHMDIQGSPIWHENRARAPKREAGAIPGNHRPGVETGSARSQPTVGGRHSGSQLLPGGKGGFSTGVQLGI